jgi:hypothetical protein
MCAVLKDNLCRRNFRFLQKYTRKGHFRENIFVPTLPPLGPSLSAVAAAADSPWRPPQSAAPAFLHTRPGRVQVRPVALGG